MPDIDLGPVYPSQRPVQVALEPGGPPPAAGPDLLSFGSGPDRRDRDRPDGTAWWWRYLPARWRRPVPRGVVAAVSAVVAGVTVAAYLELDRTPEVTARLPAEPVPLLAPESWLDVDESAFGPSADELRATGPRWEQALAGHPPDAVLVVPLPINWSRLIGLPPGSYQVRVSCALERVPESLPTPVQFVVNVRDPGDDEAAAPALSCDGEVHTSHERLAVPDYQAFFTEYYFIFGEFEGSDGEDPFAELVRSGPVVVVSFTSV